MTAKGCKEGFITWVPDLFYRIEEKHKKDLWIVFLELLDLNQKSGASEYEIYFNFVFKFYPNDIKIRRLNWDNSNKIDEDKNLHYISKHSYLRK